MSGDEGFGASRQPYSPGCVAGTRPSFPSNHSSLASRSCHAAVFLQCSDLSAWLILSTPELCWLLHLSLTHGPATMPPCHNRLHPQAVSQITPLSLNCLCQNNEKINQHALLDSRKITLRCLSRVAYSTRAQGCPKASSYHLPLPLQATKLQVATLPTWEPGCVILFYLTPAVALDIFKSKFDFLGLHRVLWVGAGWHGLLQHSLDF